MKPITLFLKSLFLWRPLNDFLVENPVCFVTYNILLVCGPGGRF